MCLVGKKVDGIKKGGKGLMLLIRSRGPVFAIMHLGVLGIHPFFSEQRAF